MLLEVYFLIPFTSCDLISSQNWLKMINFIHLKDISVRCDALSTTTTKSWWVEAGAEGEKKKPFLVKREDSGPGTSHWVTSLFFGDCVGKKSLFLTKENWEWDRNLAVRQNEPSTWDDWSSEAEWAYYFSWSIKSLKHSELIVPKGIIIKSRDWIN